MEINSFMDNDFTHLKDWGDYQSFNVENKKIVTAKYAKSVRV